MSLIGWGIGVGVIVVLASGIRIVRPTEKGLIETLGKYTRTANQGFSWIIPIIQKMIRVNITERMVDIPPQMVITKDKLNAKVDAVVYYKIIDPKATAYNIDDHAVQLASLSRTTLRAVVGKMSLTDANEKRDEVNESVQNILIKETKEYGLDVLRVEIQKIEPPSDVQESMNMVVKAEQEKISAKDIATATETKADGIKRGEIKKAEGIKRANILSAEGEKLAKISIAEGEAKAFKLIDESFKGNAQLLKQMEVTKASLENNSKIILTKDGIEPTLVLGDSAVIPVKKKK